MDMSAERVARNDSAFRAANEEIEAAGVRAGVEPVPFLCECADTSCTQIVRLALDEYEAVRANPRTFLNVVGHEVNAGPHGKVVQRFDGYVVVEKVGEAGVITEALAPGDRQEG